MREKTIVSDYAPKAKKMAAVIEQTANEKTQDGWEPVTFSVTNSAKAKRNGRGCSPGWGALCEIEAIAEL